MGPGYVGEIWVHGPIYGPMESLGSGGPFWSWGPTDCRTKKQEKGDRTQKPPIFTQDPKKAQKAIESRIINIYLSKGQGQGEVFPRQMGTRPLEDFFQDNFSWARRVQHQVAPWQLSIPSYTHFASFFEQQSSVAIILGYNSRPCPKKKDSLNQKKKKGIFQSGRLTQL
ncbi:hypothetical protein O181_115220 [Austropuccinia psidii MF-1]|uniref:Uncharacterized protein n=1 Tax=Austropuccinia psidii MF-1 TaxID=1389203 RepID=A0A9Q3K610_9BASI|nr:hypothetical protein [Austropuccinia psidii MF-1]